MDMILCSPMICFWMKGWGKGGGGGWALSVSNICQYQLLYQRARQQILRGANRHYFFLSIKGFLWYNLSAYFRKTGINTERRSREKMSYFHSFHRQERRHFVSPFFKYMFRPQKWRCHNNKKEKKQKDVLFHLVSIKTIQNSRWLIRGGW